MNKVFSFIMICLYLLGLLGGIGYALYNSAYVIAVGVAALGYIAFPKAKECFNDLQN